MLDEDAIEGVAQRLLERLCPRDLDGVVTHAEACKLLRANESTVRAWRKAGYLPQAYRLGGRVVWRRSEFMRFLRDLPAA